jgi:uncharacterized membrane protein YeaQ/YmgE (transglycosylase-associated protein family)
MAVAETHKFTTVQRSLLMSAEITQILIMLGIGAVAGWLAGIIMKGAGFGLIGNIVVGIVGAVIGTFVGGILSVNLGVGPLLGTLIWAVIGAVILLFIIGLVKRV